VGLPKLGDNVKYAFLPLVAGPDAPARLLHEFYPQAGQRRLELIPMTVALMACFLPFALAATTVIRERELHTLETLLALPIGRGRIFMGKCAAPACVSILVTSIVVLLAEGLYGIELKSGVGALIVILIPAVLASTLLGVAVSCLAGSNMQAMITAGYFFITLVLFSGFLFPAEEASWSIRAASTLLPLTYLRPEMEGWMFGGQLSVPVWELAGPLWLQSLAYGSLAWGAFAALLRRI
jgi:ABC-2 type transport system permease protein